MLIRMLRTGDSQELFVGVQTGTATIEISIDFKKNTQNRLTMKQLLDT